METHNLVIVRGLTRGTGHWADFRPLVESRVSAQNVEWLDLAGNGERFQEVSFLDNAAAARDLRARSKFIQEGRRVHLVGYSLGAMVMVEWARQFPNDVVELSVINTSCRGLGKPWERLALNVLPQLLKVATAKNAIEREQIVLSVVANNHQRVQELIPALAAYTSSHPCSGANTLRQLWAAAGSDFPKGIHCPVRVIGSQGDRLVSVNNSLRLADHWSVKARIHPTGGHDLAIDDPHWLVEQLL